MYMCVYTTCRFSTGKGPLAALESYTAHNEPILGYEKGSKERQELEAKLEYYGSKVHDVPIVIGDEEIRNNDVHYQVRVSGWQDVIISTKDVHHQVSRVQRVGCPL